MKWFKRYYLLQKGDKFAHEVAKDPSREGVKGGGEGDAAHQEDDVSGSQVCCTGRKDKAVFDECCTVCRTVFN